MLEKIVEDAVKKDTPDDGLSEKLEKGGTEAVDKIPDFKTTENASAECLNIPPHESERIPDFNRLEKCDIAAKDVHEKPGSEEQEKTKEKSSCNDIDKKTGGAYKDIKEYIKKDSTYKEGYEIHHIPAQSSYREIKIKDGGPCILMEKGDHKKTAS